jgi:hypothetical protein
MEQIAKCCIVVTGFGLSQLDRQTGTIPSIWAAKIYNRRDKAAD